MDRKMVSCFKGIAPVSFPAEWLVGFDMKNSFAAVAGEARIRFPGEERAFGVRVEYPEPGQPEAVVRRLPPEVVAETAWGPFCAPWEPYDAAVMFGHGRVTRLDDLP